MKKNIRKIDAPEGYVFCVCGTYTSTIFPTPSKSISDYELITIEERDKRIAEENEKAKALFGVEEETSDED